MQATSLSTEAASCPICTNEVLGHYDVGEVLACGGCGGELEVTGKSPLTLAEAPEVEEDWGE